MRDGGVRGPCVAARLAPEPVQRGRDWLQTAADALLAAEDGDGVSCRIKVSVLLSESKKALAGVALEGEDEPIVAICRDCV